MSKKVFVVVGLGFGDEGKGTTVDAMVRMTGADLVVRYNGGAQCAHHVVLPDGRFHQFNMFGSGTLAGVSTFLSKHTLVDPNVIRMESDILSSKMGVEDPNSMLSVSKSATVTTMYHRITNMILEDLRGHGRHGSTGMGIGETRKDEAEGYKLAAGDLGNPDVVYPFLRDQRKRKIEFLQPLIAERVLPASVQQHWELLNSDLELEGMVAIFRKFALEYELRPDSWFDQYLREDGVCVFEGAQGVLLDEVYGFFPHVTRTRTTCSNAKDLLKHHWGETIKLGITRTYQTRHGAGPMPTELEEMRSWSSDDHNPDAHFQGAFRSGALDLVLMRYALAAVGGVDGLVVTHADKIQDNILPVCTRYTRGGGFFTKVVQSLPLDPEELTNSLATYTPQIEFFQGDKLEICVALAKAAGTNLACVSSGQTFHDKEFFL